MSTPLIEGYHTLRFLGKGATGKVYLARRDIDGALVAVKKIRIDVFDPSFRREIELMQALGSHENLICLYETRIVGEYLYIAMEYAEHGEFFDFVGTGLRQDIATVYFRQIVAGLLYIHSHNIAHRDLKLENVLIGSNYVAKICDFGFSRSFTPNSLMRTICGSPPWVAPEILQGVPYDGPTADIWSMGVMLFALLSAALPVCERAMEGDPYFAHLCARTFGYEPWTTLFAQPEYADACDLIKGMLQPDPRLRLTMKQITQHRWYQGSACTSLLPQEIIPYMSCQKSAAGGPVEMAGSSSLMGVEDGSGEVFRGGIELNSLESEDPCRTLELPARKEGAAPKPASGFASLPVYEVVTEGAALPATTIHFPNDRTSEAALVARLQALLQALQYKVTTGHPDEHVVKARKSVRAGVECGLRLDLYRTAAGVPLATVARLEGDKMAFTAMWQELSAAIQAQAHAQPAPAPQATAVPAAH